MSDVVIIENPVINSPFAEPKRHFRFADDGITNEIVERGASAPTSSPSPSPQKKRRSSSSETEWTASRIEENEFINRIRARVALWRQGGYVGITKTTAGCWSTGSARTASAGSSSARSRRWRRPSTSPRSRAKYGDAWIENDLRARQRGRQPRPASASPSRWPPAAARPWSWRCSSPGRR